MSQDRKTNWEKLRLVTPIFAALSMFILTAIWNKIDDLSKEMTFMRERMASVEAQVKILAR